MASAFASTRSRWRVGDDRNLYLPDAGSLAHARARRLGADQSTTYMLWIAVLATSLFRANKVTATADRVVA